MAHALFYTGSDADSDPIRGLDASTLSAWMAAKSAAADVAPHVWGTEGVI